MFVLHGQIPRLFDIEYTQGIPFPIFVDKDFSGLF